MLALKVWITNQLIFVRTIENMDKICIRVCFSFFFIFNAKSQKVSDWFESYVINSGICRKLIAVQLIRVDLHTPKMLIMQFHTSSVWKNARHTTFIQFLKMVEKRKKTFFCGCLILLKQSSDKKMSFCFLKKMHIKQFPYMEIV